MAITITLNKGNTSYNLHNMDGLGQNIIMDKTLEIREILYSGEFKPALNTAKWEILYNAAIFQASQEEGWLVVIKENMASLFTGYLRPANSMTFTNAPDKLPLEAVDTTVLLEGTYEGTSIISTAKSTIDFNWSLNPNDWEINLLDGYFLALAGGGSKSLLHFLATKTRFTDYHSIEISDAKYVQNIFRLDRGEDIQKQISEVLWDHGFVYTAKETGNLDLYYWAHPNPSPSYTFTGTEVIKKFQVRRKDRKTKSVAVGYQEFKRADIKSVCLSLSPNFRLAVNDGGNRLYNWPPKRDDLGNVLDLHDWDVDLLQAWTAPNIRGLRGEYVWSNREVTFNFTYKRTEPDWLSSSWNYSDVLQKDRSFVLHEDGSVTGNAQVYPGEKMWIDLKDCLEYFSFTDEGIILKLKGPTLFNNLPTADNDSFPKYALKELFLVSIEAKGDLVYYYHGEKDSDDLTAPRVRTAPIADKKLVKEYVVKSLTNSSLAENLAHALDRGLSADIITFDSTINRPLGEVVQLSYPPKGFNGVGRIIGAHRKREKTFWLYSYTVETTQDLVLTEPEYIPDLRPRSDKTATPSTLQELLSQVLDTGEVLTADLDNEIQGCPADANGSNPDLTEAITRLSVFLDDEDITEDCTFLATTSEGVAGTFGTDADANLFTVTDLTVDWATVDITARYQNLSISRRFSLSRLRAGANGLPATVHSLSLSSRAINRSQAGIYIPATLTISGLAKTGTSDPVEYTGRFIVEETTDGVTWDQVYLSGVDEASIVHTPGAGIKAIRVKLFKTGGTGTLFDLETIAVVTDGANGIDGEPGAPGPQGDPGVAYSYSPGIISVTSSINGRQMSLSWYRNPLNLSLLRYEMQISSDSSEWFPFSPETLAGYNLDTLDDWVPSGTGYFISTAESLGLRLPLVKDIDNIRTSRIWYFRIRAVSNTSTIDNTPKNGAWTIVTVTATPISAGDQARNTITQAHLDLDNYLDSSSVQQGLVAHWSFDDIPRYPDDQNGASFVQDDFAAVPAGWTVNAGTPISAFTDGHWRITTDAASEGYYRSASSGLFFIRFRVISGVWRLRHNAVDLAEYSSFGWTSTVFYLNPSAGLVIYCPNGSGSIEIDFIYIGSGAYTSPIKDVSENGKPFTLAGGPTHAQGISGNALRFLPSVSMNGSSAALPLGEAWPEFSVSVWARRIGDPNGQYPALLENSIGDLTSGTSGEGFLLTYGGYGTSSTQIRFCWNDGVSTTSVLTWDPGLTNEWLHIVATFKNGDQRLYVNGNLVSSGAITGKLIQFPIATTYVGRWHTYDRRFNGCIDEMRIYNRALPESDVRCLYAQPGGPVPAVFGAGRIITKELAADSAFIKNLVGGQGFLDELSLQSLKSQDYDQIQNGARAKFDLLLASQIYEILSGGTSVLRQVLDSTGISLYRNQELVYKVSQNGFRIRQDGRIGNIKSTKISLNKSYAVGTNAATIQTELGLTAYDSGTEVMFEGTFGGFEIDCIYIPSGQGAYLAVAYFNSSGVRTVESGLTISKILVVSNRFDSYIMGECTIGSVKKGGNLNAKTLTLGVSSFTVQESISKTQGDWFTRLDSVVKSVDPARTNVFVRLFGSIKNGSAFYHPRYFYSNGTQVTIMVTDSAGSPAILTAASGSSTVFSTAAAVNC